MKNKSTNKHWVPWHKQNLTPISYKWDTPETFYNVRSWLDKNAKSYYEFGGTDGSDYSRSMVYFEDETEAVLFSLKWS